MSTWRKVGCCLAVAAGVSFTASATTYHVTPGATGGGTGESWASALTLKEAIAAAANDDVILCKAGEYPTVAKSGTPSSSFLVAKAITIRGGLKGTDDVTLDETSPFSTFTAPEASVNIFNVTTGSGTVVFENLKLTGVQAYNQASAIRKTGNGSIEIRKCQIVNNKNTFVNAQGEGLYLSGNASATALIADCSFEGNVATSNPKSYGQALVLNTFKEVVLENCNFMTNGTVMTSATGVSPNNAGRVGSAIDATKAPIKARNCAFVGNRDAWTSVSGGGCVRLNGGCGGSEFEDCRWIGNTEIYGAISDRSTTPDCYTASALMVNLTSSDDTVTMRRCTVALNVTDGFASAAGVTVVKGHLELVDSIVANNFRSKSGNVGADLCVRTDGSATISNTMLTEDSSASFTIVNRAASTIDRASVRFGDPLFKTTVAAAQGWLDYSLDYWHHPYYKYSAEAVAAIQAFDVHLSAVSPAFGLGCHAASETAPTGTPAFESVAVTFPNGYTDPLVAVPMSGVPGESLSDVTVTVKVGGAVKASRTFAGVRSGDTPTFAPTLGLNPGDVVTVEATAIAQGQTPVAATSGSGTVPSTAVKAPWAGVAGQPNVIYVRKGAAGAATGANWADAYTDIETACADLSVTRNEVWVSGDFTLGNGLKFDSPAASFALRGGFAGGESSAAERPADGSRSVVDGSGYYTCLTIANGSGIMATIDRFSFEHAANGTIVKTGAGDIDVRNCRFYQCGYANRASAWVKGNTVYLGLGMNLQGTADASASISNCVFEGCMAHDQDTTRYAGQGAILRLNTFKDVNLSDCLFLTNGIPWYSAYNCDGVAIAFSLVSAAAAPVRATRCHFVGNRSPASGGASDTSGYSGTFFLSGASGRSVFDRCLWAGNAVSKSQNNGGPGVNIRMAPLVVDLADPASEVEITGCTFAYNIADTKNGSGGASIVKGKAKIKNSIFYGNARTEKAGGGVGGNDLSLQADGSAVVGYSLFTAKSDADEPSVTAVTSGSLTVDNTLFADDGYDPQFVTPLATAQACYARPHRQYCRYFDNSKRDEVVNFDLHIKSPWGYRLNDGTLVSDGTAPVSPALDAGDPASSFKFEARPNGHHVNMGCYGNTQWASLSKPMGLLLFVR